MNYYSIAGSCLLSILVPLNFAVGCYVQFFQEKGRKKSIYIFYIIVFVFAFIGMIICTIRKTDPYVPFILMGGTVVAIIQSHVSYRKMDERNVILNDLEMFIKLIKILFGVLLIVIPHWDFFESIILVETGIEVKNACYIIYTFWGLEEIIINLTYLRKR